jgi:hypothetical protein
MLSLQGNSQWFVPHPIYAHHADLTKPSFMGGFVLDFQDACPDALSGLLHALLGDLAKGEQTSYLTG